MINELPDDPLFPERPNNITNYDEERYGSIDDERIFDNEILIDDCIEKYDSTLISSEDENLLEVAIQQSLEEYSLSSLVKSTFFWRIGLQSTDSNTVIAFIVSITKRLHILDDKWALHCLATDGVTVEECLMHGEVLDKIIGMTALDCKQMSAEQRKQVDSVEARTRWQTILANLCGRMVVKRTNTNLASQPTITICDVCL
ncbi:hypothetical protein GJ496_001932 [Pomphorhynchus laevis]|nr:hypothetical protein GJ496_001932 [Pomphorhynchus laevis]